MTLETELLAMKKAFMEMRHLLEGTSHPLQVFTDHQNLKIIRSAKRFLIEFLLFIHSWIL